MSFIRYIADEGHYKDVLSLVSKAKRTVWNGDHEKHPILYVQCPRVHFKFIIIDSAIGSANLTGAGKGMKSPRKRNFEAGILTDDPKMFEAAIELFDNVWIGKFCKECSRREFYSDSIN